MRLASTLSRAASAAFDHSGQFVLFTIPESAS
jgi:hypothetical protein